MPSSSSGGDGGLETAVPARISARVAMTAKGILDTWLTLKEQLPKRPGR